VDDVAHRDAAWVLASAGSAVFTIALALYSYYEDGAAGVGIAMAVRALPPALFTPHARRLLARVHARHLLAAAAAARAVALAALTAAVAIDLPFPVVLALVGAFRAAGAADRWTYAALDSGPAALRAADPGRRRLEEAGFLAGALAAGVCASTTTLEVAFGISALTYLVAAGVALWIPAAAAAPAEAAPARRARLLRDPDARRLYLLRGESAAAWAAVELLLVVAAIDVLGMGDGGLGWLSAAWAVGLLGGAYVVHRLARDPSARMVAASCALAGGPLALLALAPAPAVALGLLALLGVGFALARETEHSAEERLPCSTAHVENLAVADALGRTLGAVLAAVLVSLGSDSAALVAAGGLVALGIAALGARGQVVSEPGAVELA
jgi:hypothetical protein